MDGINRKLATTIAIRPCQRSLPTANSLQANALGEFAGTAYSQPFDAIKKMEEKIIQILSTCEHQDLAKELLNNNLELFHEKVGDKFSERELWLERIFRLNSKTPPKGKFAYSIITKSISNKVDIANEKINWDNDLSSEFVELTKVLLLIECIDKSLKLERNLAEFIKEFAGKLAQYIQDNSNDYPENSIKANIWMNGYEVRGWIQELVDYYRRKNQLKEVIDTSFYKAKITTSIMGHYPEEVGPDMIAVAENLEKNEDFINAAKYYKPIISDFQFFLEEIESFENEEEFEISSREEKILNSIIKAAKGLIKIEQYVDTIILFKELNIY